MARDLCDGGFEVSIVEDASAGIDVPGSPHTQVEAMEQAQTCGIRYLGTSQVLEEMSVKSR